MAGKRKGSRRNRPRGEDLKIDDRRAKVASMYIQGIRMTDIAKELGCVVSTVSKDIAAMQKVWQKQAIDDIAKKRSEELSRLSEIEANYWQGWRASQKPKEIKGVENSKSDNEGSKEKTILRREGRCGNPAFLAGAERCVALRCKILGIDRPAELAQVSEAVDDVRPKIFPGEMIG